MALESPLNKGRDDFDFKRVLKNSDSGYCANHL